MIDIILDCEADGPCPGLYSLVSFGVATRHQGEVKTYYSGVIKPLPNANWIPEALAVSGISRDEQLAGRDPVEVFKEFNDWLLKLDTRFIFWSDNLAFDWQWPNYYFALAGLKNPFGFSGRRIGDLYAGHKHDIRAAGKAWKSLRKTKNTHHPVDDAKGNLEALEAIKKMINDYREPTGIRDNY